MGCAMTRKIIFITFLFLMPVVLSAFALDDIKKDAIKCLKEDPNNDKALFNLGFVFYKNKKYKEAVKKFQDSYAVTKSDFVKSANCYNLGNAFFMQKKIKESLKWYRRGLIYNQGDVDLRYNYTVVKMLSEAKKQNKKGKNNKNQKGNGKKNKQNKDKQKQGQKNKDKQKQNNGEKKKEQNQSVKKGKMSKEDAKRILKALKEAEKKSFKVRKGLIRGVKNGKDW